MIGDIEKGVSTRNSLNNFCETMDFVSQVEPKNLEEALRDNNWILATHEELYSNSRKQSMDLSKPLDNGMKD